ncbi:MAG: carbonic anhydrase [Desulfomicrobium sp.]
MFIKRLVLAFLLVLVPIAGMASAPAAHPVSPENGLKMLAEGNLRFALGQMTHPNTSFSRRLLTTTEGQAPYATVIACSDSRVPVEILFDQGVGDLFVIKVAGNVADTDEIGSAEYGVDHLGTPVLMVLGHSYCGAVTAVTTGAEVHGSIPELVDNIVPAVEKARHDHPDVETPELIVKAIEANVWLAVEDLLTKSHAIADRAKDGRVVVVGAVYDILTGKVTVLGTHPRQTEILGVEPPAAHAAVEDHAQPAHAEPATHDEPAKDAPAPDADQHTTVAKEAPAAEHAEAEAAESGGFGFFSFIAFVILLIGAVVVLDKTILNPDHD